MANIQTPEKIVGVVGFAGAGKDTVADILADKYGYDHVSVSDWLRKDLIRLGITPSRKIQAETATRYRKELAPDFLVESALIDSGIDPNSRIVLSGIYSPSEGEYIKNYLNGILLGVSVGSVDDISIRYKRVVARSDGSRDRLSEVEFETTHIRETSGDYTGTNIAVLLEMADFVINNVDGLHSIESQLQQFVEEVI